MPRDMGVSRLCNDFPYRYTTSSAYRGRFASVIRRGRVRIPPRHIGGGCLPLNGEMVLLIERVLCQPSMSAGSWGEATQRGV